MYHQNFNPTGHLWLSALLAFLPLATLVVLLGGYRLKAHWASLASVVVDTRRGFRPGSGRGSPTPAWVFRTCPADPAHARERGSASAADASSWGPWPARDTTLVSGE